MYFEAFSNDVLVGVTLVICHVLWLRAEGKRPVGRLKSRWEDNIKMDPKKRGWEGVDWIGTYGELLFTLK
jgi:hypothetical protein